MTELTCERHGTLTRLSCARCDRPICPKCFVRTPVGYSCTECAGRGPTATGHRRSLWAVVTGLLVVAAVVGGLALPGLIGGDDEPDDPLLGDSDDSGVDWDPALGDEITLRGLTFVVDAAHCGSEVLEGGDARPAVGRWCYVVFTLDNRGLGPQVFVAPGQLLADRDGRLFGFDAGASASLEVNQGREVVTVTVNPGTVSRVALAYDVPPGVEPEAVLLRNSSRGGGVRVAIA